MFCTQCGAQNPDEAKFCYNCGTPLPAANTAPVPPIAVAEHSLPPPLKPVVEYAGFWRRFVAFVIDGLILSIPSSLIAMLFIVPTIAAAIHAQDADMIATTIISSLVTWIWLGLLISLLPLAYYTFFEASSYQATPGKMALGIIVTDLEGRRISIARALGRNAGKFISKMILYIGFIMAGLTPKKQALHDMLADCLVVMKHPTY
jgi:uncharacterized RDD family membrane protein YckC